MHVSIQANTIKTKSSSQTLDLSFPLHFRRFLHKTPQISSEQSPIDAAAVTASLVPACTDLPEEPATPFRSQPTAHQKKALFAQPFKRRLGSTKRRWRNVSNANNTAIEYPEKSTEAHIQMRCVYSKAKPGDCPR